MKFDNGTQIIIILIKFNFEKNDKKKKGNNMKKNEIRFLKKLC